MQVVKRIEIITDALEMRAVIALLEAHGVSGYTVIKDVTGTFKAWQRGTVVRSWLLELLVKALEEDPEFVDIEGYVEDSGEGRWTVEEALNNAVPVPTISASIFGVVICGERRLRCPRFWSWTHKAASCIARSGSSPIEANSSAAFERNWTACSGRLLRRRPPNICMCQPECQKSRCVVESMVRALRRQCRC